MVESDQWWIQLVCGWIDLIELVNGQIGQLPFISVSFFFHDMILHVNLSHLFYSFLALFSLFFSYLLKFCYPDEQECADTHSHTLTLLSLTHTYGSIYIHTILRFYIEQTKFKSNIRCVEFSIFCTWSLLWKEIKFINMSSDYCTAVYFWRGHWRENLRAQWTR